MRIPASVLCVLGACAVVACTKTVIEKEAPAPATEPTAATGPESIPVAPLEADPATDCPSKYQGAAPKEGLNTGYSVAGQQREFVMMLPAETSPRPLLVALNGTGEDGESFSERAKLQDFADRGFHVLAPSSIGNGTAWPIWDALRHPGTENEPNKDLDYFDSLVRCVAGHYPIDKNRIYVAGHSAGGIMTNHILQRRSSFVAGGIVASGVFSLTSPAPPVKLDPVFVIVPWGGDNDDYTGYAGSVRVGGFNFVTEASLASQFYDAEENVGEVNCRGNDIGHAWLSGLNAWFAERLLAHPKGWSGKGQPDLVPPVPARGKAVCKDKPYAAPVSTEVVCQDSAKAGCREACQMLGDCAVENGTVGPALADQLRAMGFSGANNENCGGCVSKCEAEATTASDTAALGCFQKHQAAARCEQGINGAYPLIEAVNQCCNERKDSPYCVSLCTEINKSSSARSFFTTCTAIAP
jgi:poly(3-hydroxybutyrate) depolymerase